MLVVMKGRRSTHFACVDAYGECRSAQVCDSYKFFVLFAAMFAEDVEFSSKILNEHLARQNYPNVRVTPHKTARNQAVANGDLSAGSTILATPALSHRSGHLRRRVSDATLAFVDRRTVQN